MTDITNNEIPATLLQFREDFEQWKSRKIFESISDAEKRLQLTLEELTGESDHPADMAYIYNGIGEDPEFEYYYILKHTDTGTYYLICDRDEYESDDLQKLEAILFNWLHDEVRIEEPAPVITKAAGGKGFLVYKV
mgnify:CR=1 FL=1